MTERPGRQGLPLEAPQAVAVFGGLGAQHLDRHVAPQPQVAAR